jgi:hypothetical protein
MTVRIRETTDDDAAAVVAVLPETNRTSRPPRRPGSTAARRAELARRNRRGVAPDAAAPQRVHRDAARLPRARPRARLQARFDAVGGGSRDPLRPLVTLVDQSTNSRLVLWCTRVRGMTTNDETNSAMLAVNRKLGYRPFGRMVEYLCDG